MPDLESLTERHLEVARTSAHGRSAELVLHDGALRQSVIALVAGTELAEHNSPPAASLQVLRGRVQVTGVEGPEIAAGEVEVLTHLRHAVTALEDAVFLLTTVTSQPSASYGERPGGTAAG
jgi:hypothetical protein